MLCVKKIRGSLRDAIKSQFCFPKNILTVQTKLESSKTQQISSQILFTLQRNGYVKFRAHLMGANTSACASRRETAGEGRWGLQSLLITSSWQLLLCSCFTPSAHSRERHVGWSAWQTSWCQLRHRRPILYLPCALQSQPFSTPYPPISWQRDGTCQLLLATLPLRTQFINGDRDRGITLRIEKLDQMSGINQLWTFLSLEEKEIPNTSTEKFDLPTHKQVNGSHSLLSEQVIHTFEQMSVCSW